MSPFPVRELPEQPKAPPSPLLLWGKPIAVAFAAEGALAGVLLGIGSTSVLGPLLFFVIAGVIGWVWGLWRGVVAPLAPILVLIVGELIRQALGGSGGYGPVATVLAGVALALFLGFTAFLMAAIRERYLRAAAERS